MVQYQNAWIFYRGCGHVTKGLIHSPLCESNCRCDKDAQSIEFNHQADKCYREYPFLSEVDPHFVVGKCRECLRLTENGKPNMDEPARQINPGDDAKVVKPGAYSKTDIDIMAVEWRWRIEEYERLMDFDREIKERGHETRRKMRRMRWDADWAAYRATHPRASWPRIMDLTEKTQDHEALWRITVRNPRVLCSLCHFMVDDPAQDERYIFPRAMDCGHAFHRKCLAQAFMHRRACPECQWPVNFVLKSSFDDPKSRWDEGKKKWFQVDGYVDFKTGLKGRDFFELYGKEDRWGDEA